MRLLTALFLAACLLIDADSALIRAREAMALWAESVAPSLFPFMALLPALTDEDALKAYEKLFAKAMQKLFRVSGACAAPCLVGLIAGSPAGSIAALRAYQAGAISRRDVRVLCALSTGVGPVFLISSVGEGMMKDVSQGIKILLCAWIASFLTAFLVSFLRKDGDDGIFKGEKSGNPPGAIREAVFGILTVAGYMTVFRVFAGGLPEMIYSFFEVSGGCSVAAEKNNFLLACAVVGFGGVCLIAQNASFLKQTGVCIWELFAIKAATCAFCTLFGLFLPDISNLYIRFAPDAYTLSSAVAMSMALVCAGVVVFSRISKNQRMKRK